MGHIEIPAQELELQFIRSAGPGGQNVNKVATALQLRFDLPATTLLDAAAKARLRAVAGQRLTADGRILIVARAHRTQEGNRRDALERLIALIEQARTIPKKRRATRPTRASQERRIEGKMQQQRRKRLRSRVRMDD
jgi:ribosome-associated protein